MPQISLKLSNNIDIRPINFEEIFAAIHHELGKMPNLDINSCHSGVIQEAYSYTGHGDDKVTKVYLEILWLESQERLAVKKALASKLMDILAQVLVPQITQQNLICVPRVRIANLGTLEQDYHISAHANVTPVAPA